MNMDTDTLVYGILSNKDIADTVAVQELSAHLDHIINIYPDEYYTRISQEIMGPNAVLHSYNLRNQQKANHLRTQARLIEMSIEDSFVSQIVHCKVNGEQIITNLQPNTPSRTYLLTIWKYYDLKNNDDSRDGGHSLLGQIITEIQRKFSNPVDRNITTLDIVRIHTTIFN